MKRVLVFTILLACAGCSGPNDNDHTTATTIVPPPRQQVLRAELRPGPQQPAANKAGDPLLSVKIDQTTIHEGEELVVNFVLGNATLKGDGGEYRIRYMVDDGEMQWIDRREQLALSGWISGKHILRVELIGADGWPRNAVVREITVAR